MVSIYVCGSYFSKYIRLRPKMSEKCVFHYLCQFTLLFTYFSIATQLIAHMQRCAIFYLLTFTFTPFPSHITISIVKGKICLLTWEVEGGSGNGWGGELDANHLSAAKELFFYDSDHVGRECGRKNMTSGLVQQIQEDLIQHTIEWLKGRDAVSFYTRKK